MLKTKIAPQDATLVKKYFDECKNVVIVTHKSPDGDAIGSSIGLREYLRRKGKNVTIIVPNIFPDFLKWMHEADKIVIFDRQKALSYNLLNMADLVVGLDFNQLSRIEALGDILGNLKGTRKILIDHHLGPDKFADVIISEPEASSTCELLFRVLTAIGGADMLPLHGAEAIYAGMSTDTGNFSYNSKDPDLFAIIAELLRKGIDKDMIYRKLNNNFTFDRYRLMGYILSQKLQYFPDTHSSIFSITADELRQFNYLKGDTEGIVNMPLSIRGQKLSISLREDTEKPIIWISTRSYDDFPCNKLCADFFNGGGHLNASGGHLDCSMDEAIEIAKKAIEAYKDYLVDKTD